MEHWECNWAAKRIHGREKRQVQAMYEEERARLTPLPLASFAFFEEMVRTVADDRLVRVDSSNYAARPAAIGSKVTLRLYAHLVEIRELHTGALLRTHARSERPGATVCPMTRGSSTRAARPSCCGNWRARSGPTAWRFAIAKRVSKAAAELLQTLVHQRHRRRASVLVTSNRVIKD